MKKSFILKIILQLNATLQCTSLPSPHTVPFVFSKQCWKSSFVRAFRSSADFRFTFSIDSNRVPFKADLISYIGQTSFRAYSSIATKFSERRYGCGNLILRSLPQHRICLPIVLITLRYELVYRRDHVRSP